MQMKQDLQNWLLSDTELTKKEKMLILRDNAEWEQKGSLSVERSEPRIETEIRAMQKTVPCEGEVPTPEELIRYLSDTVRLLMKEFGLRLEEEMSEG